LPYGGFVSRACGPGTRLRADETKSRGAEGLPLARAVIDEGKALDAVPAALRYLVELRDTTSLRAVIRIFPPRKRDRTPDGNFMDAIVSGRGDRSGLIAAVVALAGPEDAPAVFSVLAESNDEEAISLVRGYFVHNPTPGVLQELRMRVSGKYREKWELALVLAEAGDEEVLGWALEHVEDPLPPEDELKPPEADRGPGRRR